MKTHTDKYGAYAEFVIEPDDVTQRLRWIPPGRFLMGSPEGEAGRSNDEGPQHEVTINEGFWLFDTPVTQALYKAVTGNTPSFYDDNPELPVERVNWKDAMRFIERLNGMIPDFDLVLPTEAQWEYACRAGTTTPFWCGLSIYTDQANYDGRYPYADNVPKGEYRGKTVPVTTFSPNPWGLYDMHGNVREWCADGSREYGPEAVTDPVGPLDCFERALRGSCWYDEVRCVRAGGRSVARRAARDNGIGFRCALIQSEAAGGGEHLVDVGSPEND